MTTKKKPAPKSARERRLQYSRARNSTTPVESKRKNLLIVGIGASAGGLKAFEHFFSKMTPNSGIAFVLVPHLDPNRVSMLPELLRKYTEMAVLQANDGTKIEPDTIYITRPNKKIAITHGTLVLTEPTEPRGLRLPIDGFFRSLAEDQGSNSIGVILSGTGTDGTLGLKAIKDRGGLVIAQDLASAEFDGMPRSAIETGLVDYVLVPEKIAEQILNYAKGSRPQRTGATTALLDKSPDTLEQICHVLRSHTGHDFSSYKKSTVGRRITRRMSMHQIQDPSGYLRFLEQDPQEVAALSKDLLISVTNFFRDPAAFKVLSRVLKAMLAKKPRDYTVRVWVPGCTSGEEVYSIGIILRECMDALKKHFNVQIFGTDIDADAIQRARAGIYPTNIAKDIVPARLRRFFQEESDGYHIKKEIRELAIFSIQDLVKDPPFTKLDLLSCRNVLIYLDAELQKTLLRLFHFALRPDGILFLGASESIGGYVDLFAERNRRWKIFKRRDAMAAVGAGLPFPFDSSHKESSISFRAQSTVSPDVRISGVAEKLLLDRYAPVCVLINKSGNILYTHGPTSRYLALPQGQASLNILAMAHGRLKNVLTTVIRKAGTQKQPASLQGVPIRSNGKYHRLNVTATRYSAGHGAGELLLIAFEEAAPRNVTTRKGRQPAPRDAEHVARLEQQLWDARERLETLIVEKQSPDEDLRSYNEELQSANEELQSMNEELETSKEELQSLNEELATVNAELQGKTEELTSTNDDLRNLLDSTNIATLFLDTRLCIKRFTPEATKIINLVREDVGRPVSHFKTNLVGEKLAQRAQEVMDTLLPKENELRSTDGRWYLKRITPYRAANNVIGGVVVTFIDITERKRLEVATEEARQFAHDIVETVREPLVVLDSKFNIVTANESFYRRFILTPQLAEQRSLFELNERQWDIPELRRRLEKVLPENHAFDNFTVEHDLPGLGHTVLLLNARRIRRDVSGADFILLAFEDVTDSEKKSEELRALSSRLHAVREEERTRLAREIHDELSGSLTALKMDLSLLPDRVAKDHNLFLEKVNSMSQLIDNTLVRVRTIVTELRPVVLDKLGLVAAMEWQAQEFQERSGIACETHLPVEEIPLDRDRATAVFRILQEALSNVARHADASRVVIDLSSDANNLTLTVRDDGKGIARSKIFDRSSMGLLGMRERAMVFRGTIEVTALPERGTCVTVQIPTR